MSSEITGAEIVVRCLAEEGVEHVFGYPGGAVLYIYDAIFKQDPKSRVAAETLCRPMRLVWTRFRNAIP